MTRKTILAALGALALTGASLFAEPAKPKSVIHVITIQWKANATPAAIDAAIKGVEKMNYKGLTRVWTRPIKMQLPDGYKHIIVMEFESEQALKDYADSPAQKAWYELYQAAREESRTHDITN